MKHYAVVELPEGFAELVGSGLHDALADEQTGLRELHEALARKLADIDKREERLLDLAEEAMSAQKVRERINKLREERVRVEAEHAQSRASLADGAELLADCLGLLRDVRELYLRGNDEARGNLNDAIFKRLLLDEDGVRRAETKDPFREVLDAAVAYREPVRAGALAERPAPRATVTR